ncbi:MAG TPA: MarR family transcriptional regulator [Pseudonocardiaceae bacterium]|nr:MarR family transcriptional regulator [Pseudonocardiaceae bacterium]
MDTDFVYLFTKTTKALKIVKASLLEEHGVYVGQDFVLRALWDAEGLTPKELAGKLGIAVPTVAKMAQRMEHAGLVSRRRDEHDGRLVRVYLTDRGRAVQEDITRKLAEFEKQAIAGLPASDLDVLEHSLMVVMRNMRELQPTRIRQPDDLP